MTEMVLRACAQVVDVPENIQASEANVRQVSDKANTTTKRRKQYPLPKYLSKDLFSQWYCVYYLQVPVPTSEYMKNIVRFSNCVAKVFTRRTFYFL